MKQETCGLVLLLILCSGLIPTVALAAEQWTGSGQWESVSSEAIHGKWSVSLTRTGDAVRGTLTLSGSNVFAGGTVTGTMDASSIVLGVIAEGTKQASFSGKLDGNSISGEWESDTVGDLGVWYGSLSKGK